MAKKKVRNLILVLGDQLDRNSSAFDDFDKSQDAVWMAEVGDESTEVWSTKSRTVMFLSAMRHFRKDLQQRDYTVHYRELGDKKNTHDFAGELKTAVEHLEPERLLMVEPGEYRVRELFNETAADLGVPLEIHEDRHFLCTHEEFAEHAEGRKQLRMEYFYREMRKKHDVLMDGKKPEGGKWNYDSDNRGSFGREGPEDVPKAKRFKPDDITEAVMRDVDKHLPDLPGTAEHFDWPVTAQQAKSALKDFVKHRLVEFGEYQDAMWTDEPYLYHSRLSAAMNLKLIDPREVITAAVEAYNDESAPLNAVEGFIRQILGWREFVRGVYWLHMPEYLDRNELDADLPLPDFFWTGETEMHCLESAIGQTLKYGYAHHIQRLMVTGLFSLLLGVDPKEVHRWYLAVYVDAVEWVELPNSLGMSQYADGGVMGSKPYAATGKYIQRMSNYCSHCQYKPDEATGDDACPFTTLYWDFLIRHKKKFDDHPRMALQVKNLERKSESEKKEIQEQAERIRKRLN